MVAMDSKVWDGRLAKHSRVSGLQSILYDDVIVDMRPYAFSLSHRLFFRSKVFLLLFLSVHVCSTYGLYSLGGIGTCA